MRRATAGGPWTRRIQSPCRRLKNMLDISSMAAEYGVNESKLKDLIARCPLDNSPDEDGFDLEELTSLLSQRGGDVEGTANLAHRLFSEFGCIPPDIHSVSGGGAQVMYHVIVNGRDE